MISLPVSTRALQGKVVEWSWPKRMESGLRRAEFDGPSQLNNMALFNSFFIESFGWFSRDGCATVHILRVDSTHATSIEER